MSSDFFDCLQRCLQEAIRRELRDLLKYERQTRRVVASHRRSLKTAKKVLDKRKRDPHILGSRARRIAETVGSNTHVRAEDLRAIFGPCSADLCALRKDGILRSVGTTRATMWLLNAA